MADETELVERLRAHSSNFEAEGLEGFAGVCAEAADTIEALQRERDRLRAAGRAVVKAITAARDMVPDEEEGLAAKVFCYHINVADNELRAALSGEAS